MEQEAGSFVWAIAVIGGPIVMAIVVAWLVVRNRRRRGDMSGYPDKETANRKGMQR